MPQQNVLLKQQQNIAIISLNRADKHNALSRDLLQELTKTLQDIANNKKIHVVIIQGLGRSFSAGHDLQEIHTGSTKQVLDLFQTCYLTMRAIREMPQPVIAQVHGIATAAGCQLVAACDLAVAEENALFGTPGVKIGIFCTTPAVFLSRNIGRKKAMEMLLTGDFISAQEALSHGLVNKVVPSEQLAEATLQMAQKIASFSTSAIAVGKKAFYEQINMSDFAALNYASEVIALNTTTLDAKEGIGAFLEKRKPNWQD